jgi:hypothetical protein
MHKGFGLYSPHETTIFFLKALLLSFWIGVDLIAALVASALPAGSLAQHGFMTAVVMAILISGTVFSALFVWVTGSLFAVKPAEVSSKFLVAYILALKQQPGKLLLFGLMSVAVILALSYAMLSRQGEEIDKRISQVNFAVTNKCAEVASLENKLFQTREETVMAECLLQYDEKTVALRVTGSLMK